MEWISVEDRLPENEKNKPYSIEALVYMEADSSWEKGYINSAGNWDIMSRCEWEPITHWMPITPPKEDNDE